jgi:FkbM family methyltransferase
MGLLDTNALRTVTERLAALARRGARLARRQVRARTGGVTIDAEDVRWAYRLLLDREPESRSVIAEKLDAFGSRRALLGAMLSSLEFRERYPELAGFVRSCVVLKESSHGFRIFVDLMDTAIGQPIARDEYDAAGAALVRRVVAPGDLVIDAGANVGFYTLLLAKLVGEHGSVLAFEPFPPHVDLLERSIAENGFGDRVRLERCALGGARDAMSLVQAVLTTNAGGAYLAPTDAPIPPGHAVTPTPVVRLDDVVERRPVAFLKLDIEGAEPLAIAGARDVLEHDRPVILSELHRGQLQRVAGATPRETIAMLAALGYRCFALDGGRLGGELNDVAADVVNVVFVHRDTSFPQ